MVTATVLAIDLVIIVSVVILPVMVMVIVMVVYVSGRVNLVQIVVVQFIVEIGFDHEFIPVFFDIFLHLVSRITKILITMQIVWAALRRGYGTQEVLPVILSRGIPRNRTSYVY